MLSHESPAAPDLPALVALSDGAVVVSADGTLDQLTKSEARGFLQGQRVILCHARATLRRLGEVGQSRHLDVLELFAFVHPAQFVLPTERGLAEALGLGAPRTPEDRAIAILRSVDRLLAELQSAPQPAHARRIASAMAQGGWPWAEAVLAVLGGHSEGRLDVWHELAEFDDRAPPGAPSSKPVAEEESRRRLSDLLGANAEIRPAQADFAAGVAQAFLARDDDRETRVVLAEAGTGIGKTLGYIAPASLWAERNGGAVWLSTYTKNLQRQLDRELDRLYPDPKEKARHAVIRKGRENYLCLLNFEDAARNLPNPGLGLVARWIQATRDGDMIGGDLPAWLGSMIPSGLTDRRGECVHAACPHFKKCFIEKSVRRSRRARLVIANHALVMIQAALEHGLLSDARDRTEDGQGVSGDTITRIVFDEGHHLFDAADGAFSAHFTGLELAELRRWIRGAESLRSRRSRGLRARIGDLCTAGALESRLDRLLRAAAGLPDEGWQQRLEASPAGAVESCLALMRQQVLARAREMEGGHDLETAIEPPVEGLIAAAHAAAAILDAVMTGLNGLSDALRLHLDEEAAKLDSGSRLRIEAVCRGLDRRGKLMLPSWIGMLKAVETQDDSRFVDWLGLERRDGREIDVGMHRHWLDPSAPFAKAVIEPAHGVLITSATLRDRAPDAPDDWRMAEIRTGAQHLTVPPRRLSFASPFDHVGRTRIMIVTDVRRDSPDEVASAFRELFLSAGGGALGIFTAIRRLKAVHSRLLAPLEAQGLTLLAQHVDPIDTGTLVDIFRAEVDSCLLGTDAVRDGVDVPGRSLRLIVFDRVPWPTPTLLHQARRKAFGGPAYDDLIVRLRLKQAYGRLLRKADDKGVFVVLDAMLPSRLLTAFPEGVSVLRTGLAESVKATRDFLSSGETLR